MAPMGAPAVPSHPLAQPAPQPMPHFQAEVRRGATSFPTWEEPWECHGAKACVPDPQRGNQQVRSQWGGEPAPRHPSAPLPPPPLPGSRLPHSPSITSKELGSQAGASKGSPQSQNPAEQSGTGEGGHSASEPPSSPNITQPLPLSCSMLPKAPLAAARPGEGGGEVQES